MTFSLTSPLSISPLLPFAPFVPRRHTPRLTKTRTVGISTAIACILLTLAFQVHNIHAFFSEKIKAVDAWKMKRKVANEKSSSSSSPPVTRRKTARYDEDGYKRDSFEERRERRPSGVRMVQRVDDMDGEAQGSPKQKMRVGWASVEKNGSTVNRNGNGNGVVMGNEETEEEDMEENRNRRTGSAMIDWTRRVMGKKRVGDVEARSDSNASPEGRGLNGEFSIPTMQRGR